MVSHGRYSQCALTLPTPAVQCSPMVVQSRLTGWPPMQSEIASPVHTFSAESYGEQESVGVAHRGKWPVLSQVPPIDAHLNSLVNKSLHTSTVVPLQVTLKVLHGLLRPLERQPPLPHVIPYALQS